MDHIKVKLRSPNKRSIKRISRNQWLDFPSRHKHDINEERTRFMRTNDSQSNTLNYKGFSGITLQDYIRGNSPTSKSPETQTIKLGLK